MKSPQPSEPPASPATDAGHTALTFVDESDAFDRHSYRLSRVLYRGKTAYQSVLIAESCNFGQILVLDGALQSASEDEAIYHEMLVQPAMLAHPEPRDVLVIGGGEGATLREVLAHRSVRSATMVDLDREVVQLCREHLACWHQGAFDDPRVRLVYDDGRRFVAGCSEQYDVVIIDVVDLLDNGPAQALYTRQFYELLKERLRPGGLVVVQGMEFSFLRDKPHAALFRTLKTAFAEVSSYQVFVPSFLASWGFLVASDWFAAGEWSAAECDRSIAAKLGRQRLKHLTGEFLRSCFAHCKQTRYLLSRPGPILEDGAAFVPPPNAKRFKPE